MPNHVTQQLSIVGAEALTLIEHIAGAESAFDFNKVIPMPEELNIEESSDGNMGLAAITGRCDAYLSYQWAKEEAIRTPAEFAAYVERERPLAIELAQKYFSNQQKFGHATWYGWCNDNWGTKWNAYSVSTPELLSDRATIRFNTAWSPAIPVIVKLSDLFPLLELTLRYFDDGWNFAGEAFFEAGLHTDEVFAPAENDLRTRSIYREVYGVELSLETDM